LLARSQIARRAFERQKQEWRIPQQGPLGPGEEISNGRQRRGKNSLPRKDGGGSQQVYSGRQKKVRGRKEFRVTRGKLEKTRRERVPSRGVPLRTPKQAERSPFFKEKQGIWGRKVKKGCQMGGGTKTNYLRLGGRKTHCSPEGTGNATGGKKRPTSCSWKSHAKKDIPVKRRNKHVKSKKTSPSRDLARRACQDYGVQSPKREVRQKRKKEKERTSDLKGVGTRRTLGSFDLESIKASLRGTVTIAGGLRGDQGPLG